MRIRFHGTRGSLPKPGPETLRYGGNTSCIEVRTVAGTLFVLDAGTGAHGLGRALLAQPPADRTGHVLITHTHWDHIQGLPFFDPLFAEGWTWHIHGPHGLAASLRETLAGQMQHSYFPISMEQFAADVHYHDLVEGVFSVGDARVEARYLNHPALTLGYRIEADGNTLVYATDHEPHAGQLSQLEAAPEDERHLSFIEGADLLVHDTQYTDEEYVERKGWGHSPVEYAVEAATAAGVRRLALFHHDPLRDDAALDGIVAAARRQAAGTIVGPHVFAAAEGQEIELGAGAAPLRPEAVPRADARLEPRSPVGAVLLAGLDPDTESTLAGCARGDGLRVESLLDAAAVRRAVSTRSPSLVVTARRLPDADALGLCRELRATASAVPLVVVANTPGEVELGSGAQEGVTDWLVPPFKPTYARTRMRCWLLRTACRFSPAPEPSDEARRLAALHGLEVLDTPPEERFDRHTRIAQALFRVRIALVSLVDAERQWFKSSQGLAARETPRELAFCAHAILTPEPLVVDDALADDRFADNPLVTGPPRVRFYAGVPLALRGGERIGTLCLLDDRPRAFAPAQRALLCDLGQLVERELESGARMA